MRAHQNKPRKREKSLTYFPSHPDVIWFDDAEAPAKKARQTVKSGYLAIVEPDTGNEPAPRNSKVLPGTRIDQTFGLCSCWLCHDRPVPTYERNWMFDTLAKYALGKPALEQRIWLQDWTLRHGKFAGEILNVRIWQQLKLKEPGRQRVAVADFSPLPADAQEALIKAASTENTPDDPLRRQKEIERVTQNVRLLHSARFKW